MRSPLVTIVVPCYNYGRFVGQAMDSLLDQSLDALEVIAIDDASGDDSGEILMRYGGDPRVTLVRHERNRGNILTYNEGLRMARGEYVGLLSADDYCLSPMALERQVEVFDRNSEVGMVYTAQALVRDGERTGLCRPWPEDCVRDIFDEFRHLMWFDYVPASGTLLRREVLRDRGYYDRGFPHNADWKLWLEVAARHAVGYIAEPMYAYRIHPQNMHHAGLHVRRVVGDVLAMLGTVFDELPEDAPTDIVAARSRVLLHATLQPAWESLYHARLRLGWQALAAAVRVRPSLLRRWEPWAIVARLALASIAGPGRTRFVLRALESLRGRPVEGLTTRLPEA
ncbi:MAG: glycosyltransferase [Candidatus Dormibacteraeota bacterium]|nr:glycosyltransferase [Candidatus Dormibacteraeota bacterium]